MPEIAVMGLVLILGLGAYWSMVIFPRQREFQKRQSFVDTLEIGSEVITYGGVVGKIAELDLDHGLVYLETMPDVRLRVIAASIARAYDPQEFSSEEQGKA
ncbi:MAG: preprotein translocase subunit YajC [Anaerolineae bacterium]|nr:preprotein translocase subunit YajC [Anaerolineae bacterium]NUQ02767.1 preprotein translocase subunit YajC [Anaerolineae bacterium]